MLLPCQGVRADSTIEKEEENGMEKIHDSGYALRELVAV